MKLNMFLIFIISTKLGRFKASLIQCSKKMYKHLDDQINKLKSIVKSDYMKDTFYGKIEMKEAMSNVKGNLTISSFNNGLIQG